MANFFEDVVKDANAVEEELLGPNYEYWKEINTPNQIGMSSDGSISQLAENVGGLIAYVELLVTGEGKASKTGQPLGDKFFLKTGAKCKDNATKKDVTRYLYVNNVPEGNIPFISSEMNMDFDTFRGLIPGVISDLNVLNPMTIFSAFMMGETPPCRALKMQTSPTALNNNQTEQTEFVADADISNMDPCIFTLNNRTNPITNEKCNEAFGTMAQHGALKGAKYPTGRVDAASKIYLVSLLVLLAFVVYKLARATRR